MIQENDYIGTEFENEIMNNFIICGFHPNTLWGNLKFIIEFLITNKLLNHKPYVLLSYPQYEKDQKDYLAVLIVDKYSTCFLAM